MAASKTYFRRPNYRFLHADQLLSVGSSSLELDESDVWSSAAGRSVSPEISQKTLTVSRKPSASRKVGAASSLPVSVPDWSKILKDEYGENRRPRDGGDDCDEEEEGDRIPPHEYLARSRIASSSVHEGIGRTLKGRDLSRVRNAILQKTGFQD